MQARPFTKHFVYGGVDVGVKGVTHRQWGAVQLREQ